MGKDYLEKEFIQKLTDAQGIVHKVCGIYCKNEEQRKDLFQEIVVQLWQAYPSFRGDSKFSTWMYRVSINVAIQDFRKSKKRPKEQEFELEYQDLPEMPKDNQLDEELRTLYIAINKLNDVEKAIVMLYLEEKDNEEIAQIIGITQNYVRVKMNRVKIKLRKILNPEENGIK